MARMSSKRGRSRIDADAQARVMRVRQRRLDVAESNDLGCLNNVFDWPNIADLRRKWSDIIARFVRNMLCCGLCGVVAFANRSFPSGWSTFKIDFPPYAVSNNALLPHMRSYSGLPDEYLSCTSCRGIHTTEIKQIAAFLVAGAHSRSTSLLMLWAIMPCCRTCALTVACQMNTFLVLPVVVYTPQKSSNTQHIGLHAAETHTQYVNNDAPGAFMHRCHLQCCPTLRKICNRCTLWYISIDQSSSEWCPCKMLHKRPTRYETISGRCYIA